MRVAFFTIFSATASAAALAGWMTGALNSKMSAAIIRLLGPVPYTWFSWMPFSLASTFAYGLTNILEPSVGAECAAAWGAEAEVWAAVAGASDLD